MTRKPIAPNMLQFLGFLYVKWQRKKNQASQENKNYEKKNGENGEYYLVL
jgi:hypothetical protein